MTDRHKQTSADRPTGVGPGVTGASGDLIEGTGGGQGIGGTAEGTARAAAGDRPDERQNPGPQDLEQARPEQGGTRPSGSQSGTVGGGGGLVSVPTDEGDPGRPGGGELQNAPGGIRNVGPGNDRDTSGDRAHGERDED
jgi:hypothetical protein